MSDASATATTTTTTTAPTGGQGQQTAPTQGSPAQGAANKEFTPQTSAPKADKTGAEGKTTEPKTEPQKRYLSETDEEALVRVKIDGVEQELPIKELKRLTSLERASQKRMQEAARIQKELQQYKQIEQMLEQNPMEALEHLLGGKLDEIAEERLARKYELSQMSPVERENLELKSRIEREQRREMESKRGVIEEIKKLSDKLPPNIEKYSKEDLSQYRDQLVAVHRQAEQTIETEILGAWKESGLPQDKRWGIMMAQEMIAHEKKHGTPLQAKEAADKVKANWQRFNREIFAKMDAQAIHDALGDQVVEKLRQFMLDRVTSQVPNGYDNQGPGHSPASAESKKAYNQLEWRKAMGLA